MHTSARVSARVAALSLAAILALPAIVLADTSAPIAATGGMTATIPLFGTPLTVAVTLDPVGNVSAVDLDPVGDFEATQVGAHAVSFASTGSTAQVRIRAHGSSMSIKAKAGSLADLVGTGSWSADMFGTGEATTVQYTVGDAGGGTPTVTIDSVSAPAAVAVEQKPSGAKTGKHGSGAWAGATFSFEGFVKRLSISVWVRPDADPGAGLRITLTGKDRQRLAGSIDELVGAHSWVGTLCDGTPVSVGFTVNADGTVTYTGATGGTATSEATEHGFKAQFDGTRVVVKVSLKQQDDGTWSLRVDGRSGRCHHDPGTPAPVVNTPTQPGADASNPDGEHDKGDHGKGQDGHHGGDSHGSGGGNGFGGNGSGGSHRDGNGGQGNHGGHGDHGGHGGHGGGDGGNGHG